MYSKTELRAESSKNFHSRGRPCSSKVLSQVTEWFPSSRSPECEYCPSLSLVITLRGFPRKVNSAMFWFFEVCSPLIKRLPQVPALGFPRRFQVLTRWRGRWHPTKAPDSSYRHLHSGVQP